MLNGDSISFIYDDRFTQLENYYVIPTAEDGVYRGLVNDQGQYHGYGVMLTSDKSVYETEWINGEMNGKGYSRNA